MARSRRPRLSWFRFYADDFLGGTGALTAPECGRYLLLLLHQWSTKDEQVIPDDPERLRLICRGEDPGQSVLGKFSRNGNGLRNERLADEWIAAKQEYEAKASGGGVQTPPQIPLSIPPSIPPQIPSRIRPPTKNQEPGTKNKDPKTDSVAVAPAPIVAVSWSREACDDWQASLGTAPGGRIGHALKPLVGEFGWSHVRPLWREACSQAALEPDPSYFTPEVFARTFKARMKGPRRGGKSSVQDRTEANLKEWLKSKEGP